MEKKFNKDKEYGCSGMVIQRMAKSQLMELGFLLMSYSQSATASCSKLGKRFSDLNYWVQILRTNESYSLLNIF